MFEHLFSVEGLLSLLCLTVMEILSGLDYVIFGVNFRIIDWGMCSHRNN